MCRVKESREVLFTQFRPRGVLKGNCLLSFHVMHIHVHVIQVQRSLG